MVQRVIAQSSNDYIIKTIQTRHGDIVNTKDCAKRTLAYVTLNMKNNDFVLDSGDDVAALEFMANTYTQAEQTASKNVTAETENLEDSEYGLVVNKPIYTKGVKGSNRYLEELRAANGEKLIWSRLGSTSAEGINGMIDIYMSTLPSGEPYKKIYINMYGNTNSKKIPNGFSR